MRTLLIVLFLLACSSSFAQLAVSRIQYVYELKKELGSKAWPAFGEEKYNIPIIYFNGDTTYIANPHNKFLQQFNPAMIFESPGLKVFRLNYRIDTARLRMFVSMTSGPDTTLYDYNTPYMKCNSQEEFIAVTGFKPDLRGWAAIIMHEFFHGFQVQQEDYRKYAMQHNLLNRAIGETLQNLFDTYAWYRDGVTEENTLLLKAIASKQNAETDSLISTFFTLRNKRRSHINTGAGFPFDFYEKAFETLEGTARFIEAGFLRQHELEKVSEGDYYYATGFNMVRLLKKKNIGFTAVLFIQPSVTLEDLLKQSITAQ